MKLLFHYLAILNILDGLLTFIGLQFSLIDERNPMMLYLYQSDPIFFITVKVFLSLFLYVFIYMDRVPNGRVIKGITLISTILYSIVCSFHMYWLWLIV
ncbi:DUF5658 family protein [Bacillus timonensis]|nr:DUF5658 family protein [Bacillus timonensis]